MITRQSIQAICLVIVASFASLTCGDNVELPLPIDVPAGPPGVKAPGGNALPVMVTALPSDVPAISMISDVTFPDETLVITGYNLTGSHLRVWAEGLMRDIDHLKVASDRMLAIIPKDMPVSTMLVWPVRGEYSGTPIRVNGATAWWSFPPRVPANSQKQTLRIIGKNLTLKGTEPRLYLQGPGTGQWLRIKSCNAYHIEAELPDNLTPGNYKAWAHNGTGAKYGWSEAMSLQAQIFPSATDLKTFRIDDFGARPDDGKDDWKAISQAITTAAKEGGGILSFSPGTYHVSQPIVTPKQANRGIYFVGAGIGEHDPKSHALSGTHTTLRYLDTAPLPTTLLEINTRYCRVAKINFVNGTDGKKQMCLDVKAYDVTVEHCRFVILDRRPWQIPMEKRELLFIDNGALQLNAPGKSNIVVRRCEFHTPGAGIRVGLAFHERTYPFTNYVQIADCTFRGYFTSVYKIYRREGKPSNFIGPRESGYRCSGVVNDNGKYTIVERCDFAGADRYNAKVMNRSIQCHNSAIRGQYWAHNRAHDVSNHSSLGKVNPNMGEQYMFHFFHEGGGLFDVTAADEKGVSVHPSDPKYAGQPLSSSILAKSTASSIIPEDVGKNDHWVVFVCAGKGVGQYRVVTACERAKNRTTLKLTRPWRVVPDTTSRIVLQVVYRHNIIYANFGDTGKPDKKQKVHGVIFWFNSIENIIAGNTFRNMTAGVVLNHGFRNPTAWNLTRDNIMENMFGFTGDTSRNATFYVNHFRADSFPSEQNRVWYSVGDIARSNKGSGSQTAAFLHVRKETRSHRVKIDYPPHPAGGVMMAVIENNTFEKVDEGIVTSAPFNWSVIRQNKVMPNDSNTPHIYDETLGRETKEKLWEN